MNNFLPISEYQRPEERAANLAPGDPKLAHKLKVGAFKQSATPQKISMRPVVRLDQIPKGSIARWPKTLCRVRGVAVDHHENNVLEWYSGAGVAINGSPKAYHPANHEALGDINEERFKGFPSMVRDPAGGLVLQGRNDPSPGYCVSRTTYRKPGWDEQNQRTYLDSLTEPYVSIPLRIFLNAGKLPPLIGCQCVVRAFDTNFTVQGPVADVDTEGNGALSIFLWKQMGWMHSDPLMAGKPYGYRFMVFPGEACPGYELQPWAP